MKKILVIFLISIFFNSIIFADEKDEAQLKIKKALTPLFEKLIGKRRGEMQNMVNGKWVFGNKVVSECSSYNDGLNLKELINIDMNGTLLVFTLIYSYHIFGDVYRVVWFDNHIGVPELADGNMRDGKIVLDDLKLKHYYMDPTKPHHTRMSINLKSKSPVLIISSSENRGKSWKESLRFIYK